MDATPLTVGQELSGYVAQLNWFKGGKNTSSLSEVALGGTGRYRLNTPAGYDAKNTLLNLQDILS
jgi:fumarate hydratase class II